MPLLRFVVVVAVLVALLGFSAGSGVAAVAGVAAPRASANSAPSCGPSGFGFDVCSATFTSTGGEQQFQAPSDMLGGSISVTAIGGAGGSGNQGAANIKNSVQSGLNCWSPSWGPNQTGGGTPGSGGEGAQVSGSLTASPGETLYVEVGGNGGSADDGFGYMNSFGGYPNGAAGGYGTADIAGDCGGTGGGGGGASAIQTCSQASSACTAEYGSSSDPRLIVAGGGGGGGGSGAASISPGFGGGAAGQNGTGDGTIAVKGGTAGVNANGVGGKGGYVARGGVGVGGGGGGGGGDAGGGGGDPGSLGGAAGGGGGSDLVPAGGTQSLTSSPAEVVISYSVKAPTIVSAVSGSGTYGSPDSLTATLTSHGTGLSGKTVSFSFVGTALCGAPSLPSCPTTNGNGVATLNATIPWSGHPLPAGTWSNDLSASFAGDSSDDPSTASGTVTVGKAGSTTTVDCTGTPFTYNGGAHGCTASWASTGSDGETGQVATITYLGRNSTTYNSTTPPTNVGDYTAIAAFAGDANHNGSSSGSTFFYIVKATQTISFATIGSQTYGDVFGIGPTASSGLGVTVTSATASVCTVVSASPLPGWTVTVVGTGICTLDANQAGNGNYFAATQVARSFTVSKANQTITFGGIATQTLPGTPFPVSPTSTSGLAVSVASTTTSICTVSSNTVSLVGPGTCSLTASQAGNGNYNAATPVTQAFDVKTNNLVKDGGFESPKNAAGGVNYSAGQKIGPWSVTSGNVGLTTLYWQNAAGSQSLDLAGLTSGAIAQTVTLPYSGTYTLKFAYAGNPEGAPIRKHMTVSADAPAWTSAVSVAKTFNTTGLSIANMGWKKGGKLVFTGAAGDVVTLSFADTDGATAWGMTLDAVSLTAR